MEGGKPLTLKTAKTTCFSFFFIILTSDCCNLLTQRRNFSCVRSFSGTISSFSVLGRVFHFLSCRVIFNLIKIWRPSSSTVKFCYRYHVWCCIWQCIQNKQKKSRWNKCANNIHEEYFWKSQIYSRTIDSFFFACCLQVWRLIKFCRQKQSAGNHPEAVIITWSLSPNWNWWVYQHLSCAAVNTTAWNALVSPCSVTSILS